MSGYEEGTTMLKDSWYNFTIEDMGEGDDDNPLSQDFSLAFDLGNVVGLEPGNDGWVDSNGLLYTTEEALTFFDSCVLLSSSNKAS